MDCLFGCTYYYNPVKEAVPPGGSLLYDLCETTQRDHVYQTIFELHLCVVLPQQTHTNNLCYTKPFLSLLILVYVCDA